MTDQLMDATSVQQWLDIMQHLLVPVLWFLSWVCMLLAEGCTWLLHVIQTFADRLWLPHLLKDVIGTGYATALTLALAVLILAFFLNSAGVTVRWIRTGGMVRWTVVLYLIIQSLIPLYQKVEQVVGVLPAAIVDGIQTPVLSVEALTTEMDGQHYQPFDAATVAQRGSPLAPIQPRGADGQATALDLTLALWHAMPVEVLADAPHLTVPTSDGLLAVDTMPAGFQQAFFPDTVAATVTSPDGWTQRRAMLARGRSGTMQAGVGLLAAMVTLLPALMQIILLLVSLLTLSAFCLLAPVGLFGHASLWVGMLFKQWVGLLLWRVVLSCMILLLNRWLLGTTEIAGIALQWPLTPLILVGMLFLEWRLLKVAGRIALQATQPLRQVVASVSGQTESSMALAPDAVRDQRTADGLDTITAGTAVESGWQAVTTPPAVQSGTMLGGVSGGFSLYTLIDHDMQAARRDQRAQSQVALPASRPLAGNLDGSSVPQNTSSRATDQTMVPSGGRPQRDPQRVTGAGSHAASSVQAPPSLWDRMQALPNQAAAWGDVQVQSIDTRVATLDPAFRHASDRAEAHLEHGVQQGGHEIHVTVGGDSYAVPSVDALHIDRTTGFYEAAPEVEESPAMTLPPSQPSRLQPPTSAAELTPPDLNHDRAILSPLSTVDVTGPVSSPAPRFPLDQSAPDPYRSMVAADEGSPVDAGRDSLRGEILTSNAPDAESRAAGPAVISLDMPMIPTESVPVRAVDGPVSGGDQPMMQPADEEMRITSDAPGPPDLAPLASGMTTPAPNTSDDPAPAAPRRAATRSALDGAIPGAIPIPPTTELPTKEIV